MTVGEDLAACAVTDSGVIEEVWREPVVKVLGFQRGDAADSDLINRNTKTENYYQSFN